MSLGESFDARSHSPPQKWSASNMSVAWRHQYALHLCPHAVRLAWVLLLAKFGQAIAHVLPRGPLNAVSGKTGSLARAPSSRAAILVSTGQAGGKTLEVSHRCIAQSSKPPMPYSRAKLSALASAQRFRNGGPPAFDLCPVPSPNLISQRNCEASIKKREDRILSCCSLTYRSNEVRGRL